MSETKIIIETVADAAAIVADAAGLKSIRDVPTPILEALRNMCPTKNSGFTSVQISVTHHGEASSEDGPKMTCETRRRVNAELKRRKGGKR